ncbi:LytTR family transcriptional regulator [Sphingomonas sp. LB-2]|uniref:LytTR family DNA-binding domain-containing protein n=1 Tax=Sphingomonas caeni TaxID=2984949 RepID=UPI0022318588|nr:LytTR family DNA-binding domain-containing protein [Sphingomonas caeni]MCW3847298.1 LytTR family transcriptional regulator [Sphingomonas caeni]
MKRALGFVKRAPGFPMLWIGGLTAAGIMIVTGGFGTIAMPLGQRSLFWALLMGWSCIKWQLWFAATVRKHSDWFWAAMLGAIILCLPLPLEIRLFVRMVGIEAEVGDPFGTWGRALAIGAVVFGAILLMLFATGHLRFGRRKARTAPAEGLLERARVAAETLAAIEAEDHYCRVRRRDGSDALIHYRFGDALAEVTGFDGQQVHRGAWIAQGAVAGAVREGRRWHLLLGDGTKVAVSATHLPQVRARGWLRGR